MDAQKVCNELENEILMCKLAHNMEVIGVEDDFLRFTFSDIYGINVLGNKNFRLVVNNHTPRKMIDVLLREGGKKSNQYYVMNVESLSDLISILRKIFTA